MSMGMIPNSLNANEEAIRMRASGFDPMTGLMQMSLLLEKAVELISDSENRSFLVLYFDIEDFKTFNMNYSYAGGNRLLTDTAGYMHRYFGDALLSRLADDHFCAIIEDDGNTIDRVTDFHHRLNKYSAGSSVEIKTGICRVGDEGALLDELLAAMDNARYACSHIKGNFSSFYYVFDEKLESQIEDQRYILSHLDEAINNDHIQVYYQPIVRASTERLCVWEALSRWIDPDRGLITPDRFIGVLEDYQLIHKLDSHMARTAASHYQGSVERNGITVPVSLNFSRLDFHLCNLFEVVDDAMKEFGVPRENIKIEVTESAFMEDIDFVYNQLNRFRSAGYDLWLDDFGSGYSSLNIMKDFDFDLMKLDMTFLDDIETNEKARQMLISMICLAKELDINTICEGVETKEQANLLRSYGCDMLQGYYYSKPLPVAECERVFFGKGYRIEDMPLYRYYNTLGTVNPFNQVPLRRVRNMSLRDELKSYSPKAILEIIDGRLSIIRATESFVKSLSVLGFKSISNVESAINNNRIERIKELIDLKNRAYRTRFEEKMDMVLNGCYLMLKCEFIEQSMDREAYLVSLEVHRDMNDTGDFLPKVEGLGAAASLFKLIVFLSEKGDMIKVIHYSSQTFEDAYVEGDVTRSINEFARLNVGSSHRRSFVEFMDYMTLPARLGAAHTNAISARFMMKDEDGEFKPHIVRISPAKVHGQDGVIAGMFLQDYVLEQYLGKTVDKYFGNVEVAGNTDIEAITNIINVIPGGLFWKDKNMRFMGANQYFMDFFGFKRPEDFIGKTDDELTWRPHINVDRDIERNIIEKGVSVVEVPEVCIVDGVPHGLLATKRPFYVNGRIEGMVAYFSDNTTNRIRQFGDLLSFECDELTGLVSRDSMNAMLDIYAKRYVQERVDFSAVYISYDNYDDYSVRFGEDFARALIVKLTDILRTNIGDEGVLIRSSDTTFMALIAMDAYTDLDADDYIVKVRSEAAKGTYKDGVFCEYTLFAGKAVYSVEGSTKMLIDNAKKAMRKEKRAKHTVP